MSGKHQSWALPLQLHAAKQSVDACASCARQAHICGPDRHHHSKPLSEFSSPDLSDSAQAGQGLAVCVSSCLFPHPPALRRTSSMWSPGDPVLVCCSHTSQATHSPAKRTWGQACWCRIPDWTNSQALHPEMAERNTLHLHARHYMQCMQVQHLRLQLTRNYMLCWSLLSSGCYQLLHLVLRFSESFLEATCLAHTTFQHDLVSGHLPPPSWPCRSFAICQKTPEWQIPGLRSLAPPITAL